MKSDFPKQMLKPDQIKRNVHSFLQHIYLGAFRMSQCAKTRNENEKKTPYRGREYKDERQEVRPKKKKKHKTFGEMTLAFCS